MKQQKRFLRDLLGGLSSSMACSTNGVSRDSVRLTLDTNAHFRRKCAEVQEVLTENVRASLYSRTLKGSIPAHALWLKDDAARKAAQHEDRPFDSEEFLNEIDRWNTAFRSLPKETPGERGVSAP